MRNGERPFFSPAMVGGKLAAGVVAQPAFFMCSRWHLRVPGAAVLHTAVKAQPASVATLRPTQTSDAAGVMTDLRRARDSGHTARDN